MEMELLSEKQKRYQAKLYHVGCIFQSCAICWLPPFLGALGISFKISAFISIILLLFGLSATTQWYFKYAFPEKKIPVIIWYLWIFPAFIFQIWCIFMLPLSIVAWVVVALSTFFFISVMLTKYLWLGFGLSTLLITIYGVIIERKRLHFRFYNLPLKSLNQAFHGYKIVHLSDLHISNFTNIAWLSTYIEKINHWEPDLILITGDLLTFGDHFLADLTILLEKLNAKDKILFCMGNHDYYVSTDKNKLLGALSDLGIETLENHYVAIERGNAKLSLLGISGIVDQLTVQSELLNQLLKNCHSNDKEDDEHLRILLAHDPTTFQVSQQTIDLTLAGHTHGGQLAIPFINQWNLARRRYPYHSGLYHHNQNYLYVHRGIGTVALPLRIGVPPEIVFFTLQPTK